MYAHLVSVTCIFLDTQLGESSSCSTMINRNRATETGCATSGLKLIVQWAIRPCHQVDTSAGTDRFTFGVTNRLTWCHR